MERKGVLARQGQRGDRIGAVVGIDELILDLEVREDDPTTVLQATVALIRSDGTL